MTLDEEIKRMDTPNADGMLPCECGGDVRLERIGNDATKKRSVIATCAACRRSVKHSGFRHSIEWLENVARTQGNRRPLLAALRLAIAQRRSLQGWIRASVDPSQRTAFASSNERGDAAILAALKGEQ